MKRPEKITKLAFYLMDKEPLFYLFIINTDFIYEEARDESHIAAVGYKKARVQFFYTEHFIKLPIKQLYFILIHESYHIFKKHLDIHENIRKENADLVNIAEDAIINTEIVSSTFVGLQPDAKGLFPYFVPQKFKERYRDLGKDAYVTPRLYAWYKSEQESNKKKSIFDKNSYVKNKENGKYGCIIHKNDDGTFDVVECDSIEDLIKGVGAEESKLSPDNLEPVFINSTGCSHEKVAYDGESETYGFIDDHSRLENSDHNEEIISQKVFSEKIIKQAREMTDNNENLRKTAGTGAGNSILESLEDLMKPSVDWKKVFKRNINLYYSNNSISKSKKKSILTYLMNAKSRYGMLFRHWIKVKNKMQKYVFIAMDTSGSCFTDKYDIERFFSEIDSISEELTFTKSGRVFLMQWDYGVASPWKEYKKGDWKNFEVRGGGGTNPLVVFDYIKKEFKPIGEHSLVCQLDPNDRDSQLMIPDKDKMPFLIMLTDGIFWDKMKKEDLGYYEKNHKNVMFVTKYDHLLYDGANAVLFK